MTDEETDAHVEAKVKKPFWTETAPSPWPAAHVANLASDYDLSIEKSYMEMKRTRSSASRKKVPRVGE
jgi:hypothetical protein